MLLSTLDGRVSLPIARDGAWQRFKIHLDKGYSFTHFKLKPCNGEWLILATLRREFRADNEYSAIVGVDVGVERLAAVSVVSTDGKILRQLYFGQDLGTDRGIFASAGRSSNPTLAREVEVLFRSSESSRDMSRTW
ncbi:hypothetical protein AKJ42_01955 [candidate division MSBL1 archaeon SCGC-AAA261C02]|uniref:Uncharacterized protein n=1 Tax=candidate division MSBL1 archaeon SCGC-AAA261C02 TaxID=1698272 RepID=A0A133V0R0_9EURY|nr:hypothetical protein AKJ42_01955 [candidate division MSBL1 archaeon SCGC-AAA261C02]